MASEHKYIEFTKTLATEVVPGWSWDIRSIVRASAGTKPDDSLDMRFDFSNATQMPEKAPNVEPLPIRPIGKLPFLESRVIPYELEQAPQRIPI